jgi:hypothetical protein
MAAAAGAWLLETMNDCAYAEHVADELDNLEKRLAQGHASGADVYLLRNVAVLIDCALRDFGVYDAGRRSRNTTFDRNCLQSEARARELQEKLFGTYCRQVFGHPSSLMHLLGKGLAVRASNSL